MRAAIAAMRLYLDLDSRNFLESPSFPRALTTLELKRRDTDLLELQFLRDRTVQELPAGTVIKIGLKPATAYTAEFLASGIFTKDGTGTATRYLLDLNLNTVALNAAFAATATEPETLAVMAEVEWTSSTTISSSKTLPVTIANDVIRGDEGEPAELPLFYTSETSDFLATQAEAESGTNNTKWISPLRTFQAIAAWVASNLSWSTLTGKPSTFPPETHTHAATDITSGTLAIARIPTGTSGTTVALGNHTHSSLPAPLSVENGDATTIHEWGITSDFGPTTISFEEASLQHSGTEVLNWGNLGELSVGTRRLADVGAPIDANDAVRRIDLDGKANASHDHTLSNLTQSGATTGQVPSWNGTAWAPTTPSSANSLSQQVTSITGTSNHNLTANRWHIFTGSASTGNHTFTLPQNATNGDLVYITFLTTSTSGFEVLRFGYEGGNPQAVHSSFETGKTYLFHYNDFDTARWRKITFA